MVEHTVNAKVTLSFPGQLERLSTLDNIIEHADLSLYDRALSFKIKFGDDLVVRSQLRFALHRISPTRVATFVYGWWTFYRPKENGGWKRIHKQKVSGFSLLHPENPLEFDAQIGIYKAFEDLVDSVVKTRNPSSRRTRQIIWAHFKEALHD